MSGALEPAGSPPCLLPDAVPRSDGMQAAQEGGLSSGSGHSAAAHSLEAHEQPCAFEARPSPGASSHSHAGSLDAPMRRAPARRASRHDAEEMGYLRTTIVDVVRGQGLGVQMQGV